MSRRASLLAKQEKRKPRVRFPDELVFLDNIKDNDIQACHSMLRRASVQLDLNGLDSNGLTPLHNAVLEGNLGAVQLLVQHGADVNRQDTDTWTPLHAACANGEADIARYLLCQGASKDIKTADGERPLDLCDARDFGVISVMLESDTARRARMLSATDEDLEDEDDDGSDDDEQNNNAKGSDNNSLDADDDDDNDTEDDNTCTTTRLRLAPPELRVEVRGDRDISQGEKTSDGPRKAKVMTPDLIKGLGGLSTADNGNKARPGILKSSPNSSVSSSSSSSVKLTTTTTTKSTSKGPSSILKTTTLSSPTAAQGRKSPRASPGSLRRSPADMPKPNSCKTGISSRTGIGGI